MKKIISLFIFKGLDINIAYYIMWELVFLIFPVMHIIQVILLHCPIFKKRNARERISVQSHKYILAHRGGSLDEAENTFEAFQKCKDLQIDGIEFDLRQSSDGIIVISHDDSLLRIASVHSKISETKYASSNN